MTEPAHSKWSASGFEQKMLCPGSHVLQAGLPNSSSKYAAEGTAAHQVLTWALQQSKAAAEFIGTAIAADDIAGHLERVLQGGCRLEAESTNGAHIATDNDDLTDMLQRM